MQHVSAKLLTSLFVLLGQDRRVFNRPERHTLCSFMGMLTDALQYSCSA
jgi:hypothetical protein